MKFVWKDDVVSSVTDELYTVRDDENNIVYRGIVPEYDLFYLNRVAQKLMKRGTLDFTSGVTQHPDMSIDLTLFDTQDVPVKSEVYINAFKGEYRPDLSNPINGKLDPRMMFLWTAYNERTTQYVINGEQPEPPAFYLNLSGATSFTYNQQTSVIAADCSDWDAVDIVRTGSWFYIIKTRNGLTLSIDRNTTDSARTGTLDFYYSGSVYTSMTLSQDAEAAPSSFVLEFSGSTYFNFIPDIHMLYVTDCTDWNGVAIGQEGDWFIPTKTTDGIAIDVDTNFEDNARTGALKCYYNGILVKTVNLTQGVYSFTIEMSGNTVFDYQQQTGELAVVQCTDWANTDLQQIGDWFVATKTNTGITIQLQENETGAQRNGSIQLYYDSGEYGLVYEATITQNKLILELEISGNTSFDYTQQTAVLSAICNDWNEVLINPTGDWFTYTKTSTGITLNINQNTTQASRFGFLTLTYNSQTVRIITLSQASAAAFVLELSGETSFDYTQQSSVIEVIQCTDWSGVTIEATGDWFIYTKTGTGITLDINENLTLEIRFGFLTLFYNSQVVRIITLSQAYEEPSSTDYFTTKALGDGEIKISAASSGAKANSRKIWHRKNGGEWESGTSTNISVSVVSGDVVEWKATGSTKYNWFSGTTADFEAKGNILSLVYGDDFSGKTSLSGHSDCFREVFKNCKKIKRVSRTLLPATSLTNNCYQAMFQDCTNLTNAPYLPATEVSASGYTDMFYNCTSIISAPALPATTLNTACYFRMFQGCTSLVNAPELPSTTLAESCYANMFNSCTSLVTAPALPATDLSYKMGCYAAMFAFCTSLVNAPALPAEKLTQKCYSSMFQGCTSLVNAPELPASALTNECYRLMFCECTSLQYIKCLAQTNVGDPNMIDWVKYVPSGGTFVKKSGVSWTTGDSGIPSGWTVQQE